MQQQIPPRLSTMRTTVGLRFLCGYMNYDKQPINIDEQLALLQNRGLMIEDIATAKLQLRNISYFRIASYLRYMEQERHSIFTSRAVHSSKPSTFISLIKNSANLYSWLSKTLRFLSEPRLYKCSQWNMGRFGLWIHHCSRMQSFMKIVLTISRKRYHAQMKIS